ncbi:MAG: HNH endonuclease, partial [Rhodocyclaceae bacterium]|nr:HNH endonuclease [Rhodocyclaceae bacterium]
TNADVIKLAAHLQRSPSSVAMKLANFASLDPTLSQKGLPGYSRLDKEVWHDFFEDEAAIEKTEEISRQIYPAENLIASENYAADDAIATVKVRRLQGFFRKSVLANYDGKCCITGIAIPELLVASHIIPWKDSPKNRLNPSNGLCMNALHDKAFDRGLMTLDDNFRITLSASIPRIPQHAFLLDYDGCEITLPEKFCPSLDCLAYHRAHVFLG